MYFRFGSRGPRLFHSSGRCPCALLRPSERRPGIEAITSGHHRHLRYKHHCELYADGQITVIDAMRMPHAAYPSET